MQYYISISHWGMFPISDEQAASLLTLHKCILVDGYLLIPYKRG